MLLSNVVHLQAVNSEYFISVVQILLLLCFELFF